MLIFKNIEVDFKDDRGTIADVFYNAQIQHVAVIETNADSSARVVRGNHYHKVSTQHMYITRGSLRYWYQPLDKSEPVKFVDVPRGCLVSTPPNEIHALEITEHNEFIVFSSGVRGGKDYELDTFRVEDLILK